jgi:hypothetical protein
LDKIGMKLITVIFSIITTVSFITLLVNWYNNRLLPLIRQFFLIPTRIYEFMDLKPCFTSYIPCSKSHIHFS